MNKLILITLTLFTQLSFAKLVHPKTVAELKETSVRIMNLEMSRGGTGSIFRSFSNATHILTNKHICRLIEPGGVVDYKGKQYLVTHYKKFQDHDLCLVRIGVGLGIDLEVAPTLAKESSKTVVSGHPALLPHIVTTGHLSERLDINLMVGLKPCTEQQIKDYPLECLLFRGFPVIATFDSQLVSNLIQPGNSGSAVFNKDGKIVGVVFAGNGGDFSFGLIVPQIYIYYFLQNAHRFEWVKVGTKVDDEGMGDNRIFDFRLNCTPTRVTDPKFSRIKEFCKKTKFNLIGTR